MSIFMTPTGEIRVGENHLVVSITGRGYSAQPSLTVAGSTRRPKLYVDYPTWYLRLL